LPRSFDQPADIRGALAHTREVDRATQIIVGDKNDTDENCFNNSAGFRNPALWLAD
jgi:hypothetical protein